MLSTAPTEEVDAALKKSAAQDRCWEEYLEEQKRRLAYLQALEKQFLATRDMRFLEEFKDRREILKVELAEKVKQPCAVWLRQEDGWLEEVRDDSERLAIRKRILDNLDADARLLNPNVKIRHIKGKHDDHTYRVYEGVDCEEFRAFHRLRQTEREAEQKIKQLAGNCAARNYTTRITQEKLASSQVAPSQVRM
jgi:hypothetical protein